MLKLFFVLLIILFLKLKYKNGKKSVVNRSELPRYSV